MRLLITLLLLCTIQPIFSQTPISNLAKYWQYRDRLVNQPEKGIPGFVVVGLGEGKSIPMGGRDPMANCEHDWWMKRDKCPLVKGKGKLQWGDGTIHLGYYISVLATELRLLKDAGEDVSATAEELYYAIMAFERLDEEAERRFGMPGKKDGFFIRDDVSIDILKDEQGKNRFSTDKVDYTCIKSAGGCAPATVKDGYFVSQDQAINLLFGFTCISELIPNERYKNKTTFGELASQNTHRIVSFMRNNKWRIVGPDNKKAPNRWGGDCRAFSYSIAKTGDRITASKFRKTYQSGRSKAMGKMLHGTYDWLFGVQTHYNHPMIFSLMVSADSWGSNKMASYCRKADQEMYALADAVLNDKKLGKSLNFKDFAAMLNIAPATGPCYKTPGCKAPDGWKSNNRWLHTTQQKGNKDGHHQEWNGLDYMMLYNFFHLYYKDKLPKYQSPRLQSKK